MNVGGSAQKTSQNSSSSTALSPTEQNWIDQVYGASNGAANEGPGALQTGAGDYDTSLQNAGNVGTGALSGNAADVSSLMNPYNQNVVDAMNNQWGTINANTVNQTNANATAAGAFGGSRAAIAQGAALSQNNQAQATQTAQLQSQGYSQAMQQAALLSQMGATGAQAGAALGAQGVGPGNSALWQMMQLKGGLQGLPYGTQQQSSGNQSQVGAQANGSLFGG